MIEMINRRGSAPQRRELRSIDRPGGYAPGATPPSKNLRRMRCLVFSIVNNSAVYIYYWFILTVGMPGGLVCFLVVQVQNYEFVAFFCWFCRTATSIPSWGGGTPEEPP